MFVVIVSAGLDRNRNFVAALPSFDAAKVWVDRHYDIVFGEDDADNDGCFDAFASTGEIISIEPAE